MMSFLGKVFMVTGVVLLLVLIVPNPLHVHYPYLIKMYMDFHGKKPETLDFNELEIYLHDPLFCNQHSDCVLQLCGKAPNCDSIVMNKEFAENQTKKLDAFSCPDTPSPCGDNIETQTFAACENQVCIKKTLFPNKKF